MTFDKLRILLWKNWTLQKRRPIAGLFQIILPVLIKISVYFQASIGNNFNINDEASNYKFELRNFSVCLYENQAMRIFYEPNLPAFDALVEKAFEWSDYEIRGFSNLDEMMIASMNASIDQIGQISLSANFSTVKCDKVLIINRQVCFFPLKKDKNQTKINVIKSTFLITLIV
jgi:hypothetical protein